MNEKKYNTTGTNTEQILSPVTGSAHKFKQTFYIQDNYENKKFLGINYKKKVGTLAIPIGLCEICNKLKIEHNE